MKSISHFFLFLSILFIGISCTQNQSTDCSICEQLANQQAQAWNSHDADLLRPTLHTDHQNIYGGNTISGADAQIENVKRILSTNSNVKTEFEVAFCDKNHCSVSWTTSGHENNLNIDWSLTGQGIWTLQDGLIIKDKGENDFLGAYLRAGFTLQPPNSEEEEGETTNENE